MKTWKKVVIGVSIAVVLLAVTVGVLMGMTHEDILRVRYPDGVREYVVRRPYSEHLMAGIKYHGSYVEELLSRSQDNSNIEKVLSDMSSDFGVIISDMRSYERPKVESHISFVNSDAMLFDYVLGSDGRTLSHGAYESLMWALDGNDIADELFVIDKALTMDEMKRRTTLLATFTTEYATSGKSRRHNIAKATEYINGTTVESGDMFSYNAVVGERTPQRGFEEAKVIVNGEYVKGYGGGVCQVSTTLYNAWVMAGGDVEYATSHSLPTHYVALSRDAMVSSHNDMLLRNDGKTPLYVRGYCGNDNVTFEVYGMESPYHYDIESELVRELPIPTKYYGVDEENIPYDEVVTSYGVPGYESRGYLVTYDEHGDRVSRTLLREDSYLPQPRIVERVARS